MRLLAITILAIVCLTAPWSGALAQQPAEQTLDAFLGQVSAADLVPGADRFGPTRESPPVAPAFRGNDLVGYAYLNSQHVNAAGYSSKPIHILVGLDPTGTIVGAKLVAHSEPIVLIGVPEKRVLDYLAAFVGFNPLKASAQGRGAPQVDVVSGATVTVLVMGESVVRSAARVARALGLGGTPAGTGPPQVARVLDPQAGRVASWKALLAEGAVRRRHVTVGEVDKAFAASGGANAGEPSPGAPNDTFIDLYVALVSQPAIGRSLLGQAEYDRLAQRLAPGQHAILVAGEGAYSFKGTHHARGGVFDRIELVQGAETIRFRDRQHRSVGAPQAQGAPVFKEIGVFMVPEGSEFDPTEPWRLQLLVQRETAAPGKAFVSFDLAYRLPERYTKAATALSAGAAPEAAASSKPTASPQGADSTGQSPAPRQVDASSRAPVPPPATSQAAAPQAATSQAPAAPATGVARPATPQPAAAQPATPQPGTPQPKDSSSTGPQAAASEGSTRQPTDPQAADPGPTDPRAADPRPAAPQAAASPIPPAPAAAPAGATPAQGQAPAARDATDRFDPFGQTPLWQRLWRSKAVAIGVLGAMLGALTLIFFFQDVLVKREALYDRVRLVFLAVTLFWLGWMAQAQLSVVNVLTFASALRTEFQWSSFLVDPLIFILWCSVAAALIFWGRGPFCGWLCPFGALQELTNRVAKALKVPQYKVPWRVHERLWPIKYIVFLGLFGVSLGSLAFAEVLAEVEPFKTAIVLRFVREWWFVAFALALLAAGLFVERFFCRYLCPLGAALAIPGRLRMFDWLKRYRECGNPCMRCFNECPVDAIHPEGHINPNECISCLHCQVLYHHDKKCPVQIQRRVKREKREALGRPVVPIVPLPPQPAAADGPAGPA